MWVQCQEPAFCVNCSGGSGKRVQREQFSNSTVSSYQERPASLASGLRIFHCTMMHNKYNGRIQLSRMGKHKFGEHGKVGKYQPDDLKHPIYD